MARHVWKGEDTCQVCGLRRQVRPGKSEGGIYGRTLPITSLWVEGRWVEVEKMPPCETSTQGNMFRDVDLAGPRVAPAPPPPKPKPKPLAWERVAPPPALVSLGAFDPERGYEVTFRHTREDYWLGDMKQHRVVIVRPDGFVETRAQLVDTGDAVKERADTLARKLKLSKGSRLEVIRGSAVIWRLTW